jgi:PKD repeat protein
VGYTLKTLNVIYIIRVAFGALAALLAAFLIDLAAGTPLLNGISVALAIYIISFYLIKWQFMNKVDKPTKIFTMGIGAYFLTFIMLWVLFITPSLAAPAAAFVVDTENPTVAEPISFNAGQSADPDGEIVKYVWNFGDEDIIEETDPLITHTYYKPDSYIVTLTVVDDSGISMSTFLNVTVAAPASNT